MKITVTTWDIAYGDRRDPCHCPIARAIRRAVGDKYCIISVDECTIHVKGEDYATPPEVDKFISKFDEHGRKSVRPFTFDIPEL